MITLRLSLLLGTALIAAAGCAQQPPRADHTARAPVSAAAPATSASAAASLQQWASALPPRLLVFAYEQGWRQVVMQGNSRYFCRADVPSGSIIPTPRCVTQSQLEFMRLTVQQQRQQMTKPIPNDIAG